jgi:quercetin dioxygenase-like cupin family protein
MAIAHASPGQVIDVRAFGDDILTSHTTTLIKTEQLEVIRLVMPGGKEISEHKAPGEITVQCLEGCISFTACGKTAELSAGQMLYLSAGEPHAVKAISDASFLLTLRLP